MISDYETFYRANAGRLQLNAAVLETLHGFRQTALEDCEAGGVLLGRHILQTDDIIIDSITVPQADDHSGRRFFHRRRLSHQRLIDQAWNESEGTVTYLGEWHTHPEGIPNPSIIDQLGWTKKLLFDEFSGCLFFVIVGIEETRIWEGKRHFPPLTRLQVAPNVNY